MFQSNEKLRHDGQQIEMSNEQLKEYVICSQDIIYFTEKYFYTLTIDGGKEVIKLRDYQKKMLKCFVNPPDGKKNVVVLSGRQSGKSTMMSIYIMWYVIFHKDKIAAMLANKEKTALELLARLKLSYECLPLFLQQGIKVGGWNKSSIHLENGSRVIATTTASGAIRSYTINLLALDELAFVPNHLLSEFLSSVMPTVESGKTGKVIISSTPCGLNKFFDYWKKAVDGINNYYPIKINWWQIPNRDNDWKKSIIANYGLAHWNSEYACINGNTKIKIKDNKIKNISIEKLFKIPNINSFQVETPDGFVDFDGIRKIPIKQPILKFVLESWISIEVTPDHIFMVDNKEAKAIDLIEGEVLETKKGLKKIKKIILKTKKMWVYDLLEVKSKDNTYYTNGIVSHNCKFLGSTNLLVDSDILERIKTIDPIATKWGGLLQIYENPIPNAKYILGVDPSKGISRDFSVIQVLKINNEKDVEQVAVYRCNTNSPNDFVQIIIGVSEFYNNAEMMVECNDIGELVCNMLWNEYECDKLLNCDKKGLGIRSTKKTKLESNMVIREYLENGWLKIHDKRTIYELSRYTEIKPNVFKAENRGFDDTISALAFGLYYLKTDFFEGGDEEIKRVEGEFKIDKVDNVDDDTPFMFFDE